MVSEYDKYMDDVAKRMADISFDDEPENVEAEKKIRAKVRALPLAGERVSSWPTLADGFFQLIPKMKDGAPVIKDGETVSIWQPDYLGMADYICNELGLATADGSAWIRDVDHYRPITELELKHIVDGLTLTRASVAQVRTFLETTITKSFRTASYFLAPPGVINVQNGVVTVATKALGPRTKDQFFKYVLPIKFERKASCDEWLKFLAFVFEGDQGLVDLAQELFGYVLAGGDPWLHKAFVLVGSGRNGKSTFLKVLRALVGPSNTASVPIRALDRPFSVFALDGKLANIVTELEDKDLSSESFKIATGGDELRAAKKYGDEYSLTVTARFVIATNAVPTMRDTSVGLVERLCLVPFNRYITDDERDDSVQIRLLDELPGIMNWSLVGFERLRLRGRLPKVGAVQAEILDYQTITDSVFAWAQEWIRPTALVGEVKPKTYLIADYFAHYAAWCDDVGAEVVPKNWFARRVISYLKRQNVGISVRKIGNRSMATGRFTITASAGVNLTNSETNPFVD